MDDDEDEGTVWEIALGLVMIVLLMVGAYLLCVMLPGISYRNHGSGSEGPDNEIVGKGYRRLLEKEFQPYECTAPTF